MQYCVRHTLTPSPLFCTRLISLRRLFFPASPILPSLHHRRLLHDSRSHGSSLGSHISSSSLFFFSFLFVLLLSTTRLWRLQAKRESCFYPRISSPKFLSLFSLSCPDFTGQGDCQVRNGPVTIIWEPLVSAWIRRGWLNFPTSFNVPCARRAFVIPSEVTNPRVKPSER